MLERKTWMLSQVCPGPYHQPFLADAPYGKMPASAFRARRRRQSPFERALMAAVAACVGLDQAGDGEGHG